MVFLAPNSSGRDQVLKCGVSVTETAAKAPKGHRCIIGDTWIRLAIRLVEIGRWHTVPQAIGTSPKSEKAIRLISQTLKNRALL